MYTSSPGSRHPPSPRDASDGARNGNSRLVKLMTLWRKTSKSGKEYFSGFLGDAQVVVFRKGEREHPKDPTQTIDVWELFVQERDPSRRPGGVAR
jgi:hypothetical protein